MFIFLLLSDEFEILIFEYDLFFYYSKLQFIFHLLDAVCLGCKFFFRNSSLSLSI